MRSRLILILFLFILAFSANAQSLSKGERKRLSPKNEQRFVDEQLALKLVQDQEYEKASELYLRLYKDFQQINYFNQYIECLIKQKNYEEAESRLKKFIKENPNQVKGKADLVFVYILDGKKDKAERQMNELLKELPDNASVILNYANTFRARGLNEQALCILDKGARINTEKKSFNMEHAYIYQSMSNYPQAFNYYFLELEEDPNQFKSIKTRLQSMLFYDVNKNITDGLRMALLKKTQEKPNNIQFAELLVWLALQEEDYDIALEQSKSIDRRTGDQEAQIIDLSNICLSNQKYDIARSGFEYIKKKGKSNPFYEDAWIGLINSDYQKYKAENTTDKKIYENLSKQIELALLEINGSDYYNLVGIQAEIMAYQLSRPSEAISSLENALARSIGKNEESNLKLKLADIYLYEDNIWEATLLYSQVEKSMKEEPLGHEARFKNAQLRYFIGEFAWAQVQLDVLKAATSKLIANDAMTLSLVIKDNLETDTTGIELRQLARADFNIYQHKESQALSLLDSIIIYGNETSVPHALFRKAEIAEKNKDWGMAKDLYISIVTKYPDSYIADAALMKAAQLEHERLNEEKLALQHYEKLIDEYPASIHTAQAKKNYRKLSRNK